MSEYVGADVMDGVDVVKEDETTDMNPSVLVAKLDGFVVLATRVARPRSGINFAMAPENGMIKRCVKD
jgi:hypothetical protein